ncbi:MAG: SGNH/GDSL hydrolase family protein [Candidatus Aminicenantes bacterium]|nr:SGNH/GDSL hydrolase family protein [Candidatus Aminicenantes bacterium]
MTLGAVEVLVRIFWNKLNGPTVIPLTLKTHRFTANPVMGYELVPGSVAFEDNAWYRINQDGIRDRDYSRTKPNGTFRIAAVGDSSTFGFGLELENTWPKQLERELQRTNPHVEVINFGVMGYNTPQEAERIQDKVLGYSPDLIIIGYSLNDIGVFSRERRVLSTYKGYNSFLATGIGFVDKLLPHFKTYLLIKNRLFLKKTNADTRPPQYSKDGLKFLEKGYNRYFFDGYQEAENWNILNAAFAKIRALTQPQIPVVFVIHPELQEMDHYLFTEIHEIVKKLCLDYGFPVLDPLTEMLSYKARDLRISAANIHPNAMGNKIFAQAIARYLQTASLVK